MEFAGKRMMVRARDRVAVLVVEDNELHARMVGDVLGEAPAVLPQITYVGTLKAALEHLAVSMPDIVVLDLNLPDSLGLETLHRVRAAQPDAPIVVFTAVDEPETAATAIQAGASEYLVKGRLMGDLLWRVMRSAIDRAPAPPSLRALSADVERRTAERSRALELAHDELETFVHSAAHGLRTPLRSIGGLLTLLGDDLAGRLDEDGADLLDRVVRNVERMDTLLTSLVHYAGVAEAPATREVVDLAAIARAEFAALAASEHQRQIRLVAPERLLVDGDPALLRLALRNLLSNAWRCTGQAADAFIELGALDSDPDVIFVRDNGVGLSEAEAAKVFEPFARLRADDGVGLGLAAVKQVVGRHLGSIWAESSSGCGATFYFTLGPNRGVRSVERAA